MHISYRLVSKLFKHCFSPFFQNILGRIATTKNSANTMLSMVRRTMMFLKTRNSTNIKSLGRFPGLMHRRSPSQCPKSCWFSASPPEATEEVTFTMLGQERGDSESEEDDEKEKEAEQINVAEKDCGIVQGLVCIYNISTCHSNPYHIEPLHVIPFRGNTSNCHTNRQ